MTNTYYVNKDNTTNPKNNHEVHTSDCKYLPSSENRVYLGRFNSCRSAVSEAKQSFTNVDGCAVCCPNCHKK